MDESSTSHPSPPSTWLSTPEPFTLDENSSHSPSDDFVILSAYTYGPNGRDYDLEKPFFLRALERTGHLHQLLLLKAEPPQHQHQWWANTLLKPIAIQYALNHLKPVLWLDIDARVLRPLPALHAISTDIAARLSPPPLPALQSGTLLFNPTDRAFDLVARWTENCQLARQGVQPHASFAGDQELLARLVKQRASQSQLSVTPLHANLCFIDQIDPGNPNRASIYHTQASRRRADCRPSSRYEHL